jgi:transcriptional regulator with XRE-family HTH domain
MSGTVTVSQQLLARRKALDLSLSDLARRAGTSAATLSRYENGWTRFETYTLRKLATALDCDLHIELRPKTERKRPPATYRTATLQLKRLFWDHSLREEDLRTHATWVVERVLDYGNLEDIGALLHCMGRKKFLITVASAHRVTPRTRQFWCQLLEMEGVSCTRKYSRNTAWNS